MSETRERKRMLNSKKKKIAAFIILLICLPFVVPTMNRCIAETTEDDPV